MSSHPFSDQEQNDPAHGKLRSAEYHRRYLSGKNIDQHRGHSVRKLRDQNKSFSCKPKTCIQRISHEIDHDHAGKTEDTAEHLSPGHFFLVKNKAGQQDRNKIPKTCDNSAFYTRGMCHTYIKEEILTYRLSHTYRHRIFQNSSIRKQNLALTQRCKDQYKDSCQCKTHTCKNDLTCRICRIHLHQTVSCLNQRDRTPPEETADAGKRCHHPGFF